MQQSLSTNPKRIAVIKHLYIIIPLLLGSFLLPRLALGPYIAHIHQVLEYVNVFIAFTIFVLCWCTYAQNSFIGRTVGMGFLIVGSFNLVHVVLSNQVWVYLLDRFESAEAIAVATLVMVISKEWLSDIRLNRWVVLLITIVTMLGTALFVYSTAMYIPNLFLKAVAILLLLVDIFLVTHKMKTTSSDIIPFRYILFVLMYAVPALLFEIYADFHYDYVILATFLKTSCFYFAFKGLFAAAVTYPYAKLENILNSLTIGLVTSDDDQRISFVNKKMAAMLGSESREFLGQSLQEVVPGYTEECERETMAAKVGRQIHRHETFIDLKNGQGGLTKVKVNVSHFQSGGSLHLFSDAKQEQELQNLQIQTQTVLESIDTSIVIADKAQRIISCNQAFLDLTGLKETEVIGKEITGINQILQSTPEGILKDMAARNGQASYQASIVTPAAAGKEVIVHSRPVLDVYGQVMGSIIVATDVTQMKQEQEKLKQQEKLAVLGQMAAGIVHEIRNPLTSVKGFVQLIGAKLDDPGQKECIEIVLKEVDSINLIISDFLSFAKPQYPVLKKTYLSTLLKSFYPIIETKAFMEGVKLQLVLDPEEKEVMIDDFKIRQVILNLVTNAIESMDNSRNPSIRIAAKLDKVRNEMLLTISDNGKGMTKENIALAGTPFFTTKDRGTGLGLNICYQIIQEHNGLVEIDSVLGQGTCITIVLRCIQDHSSLNTG